MNSTYRSLKTK